MARPPRMCPHCREVVPVIVHPKVSAGPLWVLTAALLIVFWPAAVLSAIAGIATARPEDERCAQCGGSMIWRPVWAQVVASALFVIVFAAALAGVSSLYP